MIDWLEQWQLFAPHFRDGLARIPVGPHTLFLKPGPGFGDLSHPTTQLMLSALAPHVANRRVLDVGCGSGILTLASLLLGATAAHGIDIERDALAHARENNALNNLSATFSLPPPHVKPDIALMNMIVSEQRIARTAAPLQLTSGILLAQRDAYLAETATWGWTPLAEFPSGEWLAVLFRTEYNREYDTISPGDSVPQHP